MVQASCHKKNLLKEQEARKHVDMVRFGFNIKVNEGS
jgi:hypothetical protein